ncbi:MAG: hypothetical protein AAGN46_15240, partial [Acidobacteriota bacterium]
SQVEADLPTEDELQAEIDALRRRIEQLEALLPEARRRDAARAAAQAAPIPESGNPAMADTGSSETARPRAETGEPSAEARPTAVAKVEASPEAAELDATDAGGEDSARDAASATAAPAAPGGPSSGEPAAKEPARRCSTLVLFDSDGDGLVTAFDRYWRHLYLWTDADGDGRPSSAEMTSPYERNIRGIDVDLRHLLFGKGDAQTKRDIQLEELVLFDVSNDGLVRPWPRGDDGALSLNAAALRRAGWTLDAADGKPLDGIVPIRNAARLSDGERSVVVDCPRF